MQPSLQLVTYCAVIVLGAVAGAYVPLRFKLGKQLTGYLAFAAGVMLGAAFFHMLPESLHAGGYSVLAWVPAGFVVLFILERYVLVHVCEEPPDCKEHLPGPAVGLAALIGMSVHTLFDGVALASATLEGVGFMAFTAIVSHKIPSSLSLAAILKSEGRSNTRTLAYSMLLGLMVPVGVGLYLSLQSLLELESFSAGALAFSAGSFLYIAVSDLLPHVNRHGRQNRLRNVLSLLLGLLLMFLLGELTDHAH